MRFLIFFFEISVKFTDIIIWCLSTIFTDFVLVKIFIWTGAAADLSKKTFSIN